MRTNLKRSPLSYIPGYGQNAVLQLIAASGVVFIAYHFSRVIMLVAGADLRDFYDTFTRNTALPQLQNFTEKFWTVFTYGWIHNGFWELFSNMIWLYCFGSVVQMLVGYKQLIPLYAYALITGGIFYQIAQLIPGDLFHAYDYYFGASAGVIAFAVAAITLSPDYRFYLTEHFSIPLIVIAIIFFALSIMNTNLQGPPMFLLVGGAAMGFGYVKLLKSGYKPGEWFYNIFNKLGSMGEPVNTVRNKGRKRGEVLSLIPESKKTVTEKRVDDILDKINQKGYNSLTKEEKEILLNASKNNEP